MVVETADFETLIRGRNLYSEEEANELFVSKLTIFDYLKKLREDARPARTSFQRVDDMIEEAGVEPFSEFNEDLVKYKFFSDIQKDGSQGPDAIFGLEKPLMKLVEFIKAAALGFSLEKRMILLHGPVGSSKSTIARLLKGGMEAYSWTNPIYTFEWQNLGNIELEDGKKLSDFECQMHEDPIKLLDRKMRFEVIKGINENNFEKKDGPMKYKLKPDWGLCIHCEDVYSRLMKHYKGDWEKVVEHIVVKRFFLSEARRIGISSFLPKDEKNQDSTELTGNVNYRNLAVIGDESDPRAFNLSGEFCKGNRGLFEVVEELKLETAFLYDFLTASQEKRIKPKNFALIPVDLIILGHTNHADFVKLQNDQFMEAFRDRTERIDIPYNTKLKHEEAIYCRDYNIKTVAKHIAPFTIKIPSIWAILSRLEEPKELKSGTMTLIQKLKLYNGEKLTKFGEEIVKKLHEDAINEGMEGISPRFIQDAVAYAAASEEEKECVNPFMVLRKIKDRMVVHGNLISQEQQANLRKYLEIAEDEYAQMAVEHVELAISSNEDELTQLCNEYIKNITAYSFKEKIRERVTRRDAEPDERLMRAIEEKIDIAENQKDEFRGQILKYIGGLAAAGNTFDFKKDEQLKKALSKHLFESRKDKLKLDQLFKGTVDKHEQEKIDVAKKRLIENFGYCDVCSTNVLNYVANIMRKGDIVKK